MCNQFFGILKSWFHICRKINRPLAGDQNESLSWHSNPCVHMPRVYAKIGVIEQYNSRGGGDISAIRLLVCSCSYPWITILTWYVVVALFRNPVYVPNMYNSLGEIVF